VGTTKFTLMPLLTRKSFVNDLFNSVLNPNPSKKKKKILIIVGKDEIDDDSNGQS
jgi:hypothetical protein